MLFFEEHKYLGRLICLGHNNNYAESSHDDIMQMATEHGYQHYGWPIECPDGPNNISCLRTSEI